MSGIAELAPSVIRITSLERSKTVGSLTPVKTSSVSEDALAPVDGAVMFVSYKVFTLLAPMLLGGPSSQNLFVIFASLFCGLATYGIWAKLFNLEQWQLIRTTRHSTEK